MQTIGFQSQQFQGVWHSARDFAGRLLERWLRSRELARQRRELLELDAHMLKDIGISRVDALREAARSNWDDPLALPQDRPRPQLHGWLPGREG